MGWRAGLEHASSRQGSQATHLCDRECPPDLNGADRAGDNLFTASIVSVNIETGKLNWYFQEVHHDIWDYDGPQPVALFTVQKDGQEIPAVGHANKNGYYYILDRRNGNPVFDVTETAVPAGPAWQHPSPTQPIPATEELIPHEVSGQVVISDAVTAKFYTPPQEQALIMQPGAESGSEWPPAAYSPRTGYVYIPAGGYEPWYYQSGPDNADNLGSTLEDNPSYKAVDHYGLFDALDTQTGKLAWQIQTPDRVAWARPWPVTWSSGGRATVSLTLRTRSPGRRCGPSPAPRIRVPTRLTFSRAATPTAVKTASMRSVAPTAPRRCTPPTVTNTW